MGERVRREYADPSGTRLDTLTAESFARDARTGQEFGGIYFVSGTGTAAASGTIANPTTLDKAVPAAGDNGVVVVMGGSGDVTTSGVTLSDNGYLIGGNTSLLVQLSNNSLTSFNFGGTSATSGTVVGTDPSGAAVTLGQGSVVKNLTITGAGTGILANGVGGFQLEKVVIRDTGADGLALLHTSGSVLIDGLTVTNAGAAGVSVVGGDTVAIRNSTISGGAASVDVTDGGDDLQLALSALTLSASDGAILDIDGSGSGTVTVTGLSNITLKGGNGETGGFAATDVVFDADPTTAGFQAVDAGTMTIGSTTDRVGGDGLALTDVTGSLKFGRLDIANSDGTGLIVSNDKSADFTLATLNGSVDTVGGTAIDLDPLKINLTFSTVKSTDAPGAGVVINDVQGVGAANLALMIGNLTVENSGAQGLLITGGSTGLVVIGDGSISNSGGRAVQVGEEGVAGSGGAIDLWFGADIDQQGDSAALALYEIGGKLDFTGAISGSGGIEVLGTLAGSAITIAGPSLEGTSGPAIRIDDILGTLAFTGTTTIANPLGDGIVIGNVPGGVVFGDVDITGLGAATGLDLTGTQGTVVFNTLDISGTGAAGSKGIDLSGSTNTADVTIANPSTIMGVDIGVDLTNAGMSGTFRYGDGNANDGLESTISANVPLVIAGLDGTQGSYNFADVKLIGDLSNLTLGEVSAYYVQAGATGTGTVNDPGSLAGAEASGASYIVLLNDPTGGQDVLDAADAGGSFDLDPGQQLVSFLNGDTISVSGIALPSNLIVSGLPDAAIVNPFTGSGSAVLTTSMAGFDTVNLASNSTIDGVVIANGGTGVGVAASGVSNASILNSNVSGAVGAVSAVGTGTSTSLLLSNVNLSAATGTVLSTNGASGNVTISGSGINVTATGDAAALSMIDTTAGSLAFGTIVSGTSAGSAVSLNGVTGGPITADGITIGGTSSGPGLSIANSSATIDFDSVSVANSAGNAVDLIGNSGDVTFGSVNLSNAGGDGLSIQDESGNITIDGGTISGAASNDLVIDNVLATGDVRLNGLTLSDSGTAGIDLTNIDGAVTFTGTTTISNPGTSGIVLGAGSNGTITFGNTDIIGLASNTTGVDATGYNSNGTVTFATLDITGSSATGTRGIDLTGAVFSGSIATTDSGTITGVGIGVDLTNAAITGTFRYGDGSNTDSDHAASTINATTPLVIAGLNGGVGTYNFADVNLVGDTSALESTATIYYVQAGASGTGTRSDPGSLAGAEAANVQYIVLLNNPAGGQDTLDSSSVSGLDLDPGQTLFSFLNTDTMLLPGGVPNNVVIFGIVQPITNPYTGSGAPILTSSAGGGSTVILSGNNIIDGVIIANGGTGVGIFGNGATGTTIIRNSVISGNGGAILFRNGVSASSLALHNLTLSAGGSSDILNIDGTVNAGVLTVTDFSDLTAVTTGSEGRGFYINGVTFDADTATAGVQAVDGGSAVIGTTSGRINGAGLTLANVKGALSFDDLDIANTGGTGLQVTSSSPSNFTLATLDGTIDTTLGSAVNLNSATLSMVLSSVTVTGGGFQGVVFDSTEGNFNVTGTTTLTNVVGNAILINSTSNGTITFGSVAIDGSTGTAVSINNASGTVNINGGAIGATDDPDGAGVFVNNGNGNVSIAASITKTTLNPLVVIQNRTGGTVTFSGNLTSNTAALGANAGHYGILVSGNSGGTINFTGQTISLNTGVNTALALTENGGTTINFNPAAGGNGLDIVTTSGTGLLVTGGGTINITGTGNSITSGSGTLVNLFNNTADTQTLNATFASASNTSGARGILVQNTSTGSIGGALSIAGGSITSTTTAVEINGGSLDLTYGGSLTQSSGANAVRILNHDGTVIFNGAVTITDGSGLDFEQASGTYTFNGPLTLTGSARVTISSSNGDFTFANASIANNSGAAFTVENGQANVTYSGSLSESGSGQLLFVNNHSGGTLDFTGASLSATGGSGLQFNNADGTYKFDDVTLSGGNTSIDIFTGSGGTFTFGDVDITGVTGGDTAVDLRGLGGSATFATLDITGASASGTRGIDLSGNTTSGNIIINESSTITGVGIGVDLTNAALTGTFRYGDGSNVDADGAASTINATTPLVIAGMNGGVGTYNFADVNLVGDTSNLSVSVYYVKAGASGVGTLGDPGSLAGAEASGALYIVLLNDPNGGDDVLNASALGDGSFNLADGQSLLSFEYSETFNVGGGAPANLILFGISGGSITNPYAGSGAPTLTTTSGGASTVTLTGNNIIDGVIIANGGTGVGVYGNGATGATIIRNSFISGNGGAILFRNGVLASSLALHNLTLSAGGSSDILNIDGTVNAGVLTVTDFSDLTAVTTGSEGRGFYINGVTFDADTATAGIQTVDGGSAVIGTTSGRINGAGLTLANVKGALSFDDLDIANTGGTGLSVANSKLNGFTLTTLDGTIDTTAGTAINLDPLTLDMTLSSVTATGGIQGVVLDSTEGDFTVTGTTTISNTFGNGIQINATSNGTITFANVAINGTASSGVSISNATGTVNINGGTIGATDDPTGAGVFINNGNGNISIAASITKTTLNPLVLIQNRTGGTVTFSGNLTSNTAALGANAGHYGILVSNNSGGTINFTGQTISLNTGVNTALGITENGGTAINFNPTAGGNGLDIVTTSGTGLLVTGGGNVNILGTGNSITSTSGTLVNLFNNTADTQTLNATFASASNTSGATGFSARNVGAGNITGDFTINGGSITATTDGVLLDGGALNFTYGGSITTSGNSAHSVQVNNRTGGTATFSGNITDTSLGINVSNNTGGSVIFSGASKVLNMSVGDAFTMAGNSAGVSVSFLNGGLDIDTTNFFGLKLSGNGDLTVSGANNSITSSSSGTLVSIFGGNGTIDINATLQAGPLSSPVVVSNRTGGVITFSGNLGRDLSSEGILLQNNTAGSVVFSGTSKVVGGIKMFGNSSGFSASFINGGMQLTNGNFLTVFPLDFTGNGDLTISGPGNTLNGNIKITGGNGTIDINSIISSGSIAILSRTGGAVTFSGNLSAGSGPISIQNNTGGTITFSGTSKVLNTTTATALSMTGNSAGVAVNFLNGGLDIDTTSGTGILVTGGGDLTVSGAGNTITTTTGTAVDIGAGTGTININAVISTGSGLLASIQGRTGGTVTLSGNLSSSGISQGLLVQNNTGGTFTFSGTSKVLNTGANSAVRLLNNTGATINFTGGGLDIDTTTGTGFLATGGGTITVQGTNNTINSISQTALNVANTTIGASGLTFQSISSGNNTAAADPVNGIVLNNTGAGGLTITGTGTAGSGGTIQNTTGTGISLTSTGPISLDRMVVQGSGDDGIFGSNLAGFRFDNGTISGNGNVVGDRGVELNDVTGTVTLNSSVFTGSAEDNVYIRNTTGTMNLTVNGSTFSNTSSSAPGNDGLLIIAAGNSQVNAIISGSTFANNRGDHFQLATEGGATSVSNITFTGNTLTTSAPGAGLGGGITISSGSGTSVTFDISNNNIQNAFSSAININLSPDSTSSAILQGVIKNNIIGTAGVTDSGSFSGDGIDVINNGAGTTTVLVDSNTIRQYSNGIGINLILRDGNGRLNATVTNNNIANPGTFGTNGIVASSGATATDAGSLYLDISGNSIVGSSANGGTDFRIRQRFDGNIFLKGYSGGQYDTAAVIAYVQGLNPGAETGSATVQNGSPDPNGFFNTASVPQPASPTTPPAVSVLP